MPPKRHGKQDDSPAVDIDDEQQSNEPVMTITESMLQALVAGITRSQAEANRQLMQELFSNRDQFQTPSTPTPPPDSHAANGNFAKCTARFDGSTKNADVLEAFIDAIVVYKECTNVSDEHAVKGLPILLTGEAAIWWQGVKASVSSWEDALRRLRGSFGVPRPAHKIFRDIFASAQQNERADAFISKVRALLAKLPYEVPQQMCVDIVYGLLSRKIRKRVSRDDVNGLEQLVAKARLVEESLAEVSAYPSNSNVQESLPRTPDLPTTSHGIGSNSVVSRSVGPANVSVNPSKVTGTLINPPGTVAGNMGTDFSKSNDYKRSRPRCSYCKLFGHTVDECRKIKSSRSDVKTQLHCYGCGQLGVVRSKCPKCKNVQSGNNSEFQSVHVNEFKDAQPLVPVLIAGRQGIAMLDTGATHSIAGPMLHRIFVNAGVEFKRILLTFSLADGSQQIRTVHEYNTIVTLMGRDVPTTFVVLPEAETRTLLGRDFIRKAKILLDLPQNKWSFSDCTRRRYPFATHYELPACDEPTLMKMDVSKLMLREDEGTSLTEDQRTRLNELLINRADRFAKQGSPTDYALHRIKVDTRQEPIASPPYRMAPSKRELLERELQKLLDGDIIEECESPWAANVVLVTKKDGGVRLCVDYRKLNAVTEPDRYPLPRIEDVLHAAKNTSYMTTCDLRSGYYQIAVEPEDRDKTAFVTPLGTFRFKRMPMGLRNSGSTFQRLMDRFKASKELSNTCLLTYLDDVIILSESFPQHIQDLNAVFDRLETFNLRINREKSCFARESVKFLGHVIVP
ncbi:uncharacterized protein LOC119189036 [Manduca sexta]|uniref:uncharacterized protein LOC119189036 n=1 Tax=Manduca sexta TaxID=7130 RepID=UPI0018903D3C|nr:uncharacterized protein LOC119189036 [Manduca sexta]